jgi:polar amino acid transport system permease protein
VNISFFLEYAPRFAEAARLTVILAASASILSIGIGLVCAVIRYYRVPVLRQVATAYIELSRNTPLMIQLFFLYYGLTRVGLLLEGMTCAIFGLSFLGGGYMAEAFRGGLEAVDRVQIESGLSLGLKRHQVIRYVILPQAFAVALPAISANVIFLIKETSVVSIIALADIMYVAKDLMIAGHSTETNIMLSLSYLIIILPISGFFYFLERRTRHAGFGN